jgi:hypothetical protein
MEVADVLPELPVHDTVNWVTEMLVVVMMLCIYSIVDIDHGQSQGNASSKAVNPF